MDEICAGIVLYNPDINRLKENIEAIIDQVGELLLIDNNSGNIDEILAITKEKKSNKIHLVHNDSNKGIAYALNIICSEAEKRHYEWVVTLDQDSVCPSNLVNQFSKHISTSNIALISPFIQDRNMSRKEISKAEVEEINQCITSGSMLSLKDWKAVGGFDESMFIDGVDFDYCIRLRKNGRKIIKVNNVVLLHELGNIEIKHFLIWNVIVKNHAPFRKYYIARNTIYLARKHRTSVIKAYLQVVKQFLICAFYEKDKAIKCKEIIKGTLAGVTCKIE